MSLPGSNRIRAVSTVTIAEPRDEDIASLVDSLRRIEKTSYAPFIKAIEDSTVLLQLKHILKDDSDLHTSKGGFRRVGGYNVLLNLLDNLVELHAGANESQGTKRFLQALSQLVSVLGISLEGHAGNQRYFRTRATGDGWTQLQSALRTAFEGISRQEQSASGVEHFFGLLLATAVSDETAADAYAKAAKLQQTSPLPFDPSDGKSRSLYRSLWEMLQYLYFPSS
jgi:hypothetical protein